jgi:hypothetical protein
VTYDLITKQYLNSVDVKVASMRELKSKPDYGSTLEVIYDLKSANMTYKTAANLAIFPLNQTTDVERFA